MAAPQKPFSAEHKTELLDGDKDLFGDGSLTILSTPGAGHQSLLVHPNKTGYVLLTGDAVHFHRTGTTGEFLVSTPIAGCRWTRWTISRALRMRSTPSSGSITTNRRAMHVGMLRSFTTSRLGRSFPTFEFGST
jgi:hypothetical protein